MDDVVRDATMMGAAMIQPVVTAHLAVKPALATPAGERRALAPDRDRVGEAVPTRDACRTIASRPPSRGGAARASSVIWSLMFVEPSAEREAQIDAIADRARRRPRAALVVGPEGGWAEERDRSGGGVRRACWSRSAR